MWRPVVGVQVSATGPARLPRAVGHAEERDHGQDRAAADPDRGRPPWRS
ncbi:hypothetical protein [Nocardioides plantarum]